MTTAAQREAATAALLVERAKAGEPHAFDALVRRYRKRIFALALHLSGSESDADDIVQDVFIRAFRALDQFEGRSEFFTWVYRLTVNRAIDGLESGQLRVAEPDGNSIELVPPHGQATVESDPAVRALFLWGRRPADPTRWHSSAGPEELGRLRALLTGY